MGESGLASRSFWWKALKARLAAGVYIYAVEDIRVDERSGFGVDGGGGVGHGRGGRMR